MMQQLDVFENPSPRARRGYPLVAVLQSHLADTGRDRVVAPLIPCDSPPGARTPRLLPLVQVNGRDYALLVPRLVVIDATDLRQSLANLDPYRGAITAALGFLFFGI
jgi:toxin CcdB